MKNYTVIKGLRCCLLLLLLGDTILSPAQNVNTPNKIGPLGIQVNTLSGNLFLPRVDLYVPGRGFNLSAAFFYNSFLYGENVGFGNGWSLYYHIRYRNEAGGGRTIVWGDGREDRYKKDGSGNYKAPKGFFATLTEYQPSKLLLRELDGTRYYFDNAAHRKLTRLENARGQYLTFQYTDSLLKTVSNAAGQLLTFNYDGKGQLTSVVDAMATPVRTYSYGYDAAGNLTTVTDPLGGKTAYAYLVNGPLKSMTDKNSNVVNVVYFNDFVVSEVVGCNKRISFSYDSSTLTSYVTDHIEGGSNQVTTYKYKQSGEQFWLAKRSGNCCGFDLSFEHDENGNVVRQTDANGNIRLFTYDGFNNLLSITDPNGHAHRFSYTTDFYQLKTYTDPKGNVYELSYDNTGNLTKIIQPGGISTTLTYAATGDLTGLLDARGNTTAITYDSYGNVLKIAAPLNTSLSFTSNARGQLLSVTDAKGNTYTAQYDALGRVTSSLDPLNQGIQMTYDAMDNLLSYRNEAGQLVKYGYDASNRVVRITNAKGFTAHLNYDAMDNLVSFQDYEGHTTTLGWDNLNRLNTLKDPLGNTASFSYDRNGNLLTVSLPNGRIITNTFDKSNRLLTSTDNEGPAGTLSYDANGNLVSVADGAGATYTLIYDALNRLVKMTDPLGSSALATYDNLNNLLSLTNRRGQTKSYTYDAANRRTAYTDYNGFSVQATYDLVGNITALKDQNNNTTTYQYDALNRITRMTYPNDKAIVNTYDKVGNVLAQVIPSGATISYQYDSLNRQVLKTLPGGEKVQYEYDRLNRLTKATNANTALHFSWDAVGQLTSEGSNGQIVRYGHNTPQRQLAVIYPDSTTVFYNYTRRGLLSSITKDNQLLAGYQYNAANMLTRQTYRNGVVSNYQYDFANRLTAINTGNGALQNKGFTYDNLYNRTLITQNSDAARSEQFTYDNGSRLTSFKRGNTPGMEQAYVYDAVGNRKALTVNGTVTNFSVNNMNQLTTASGTKNITYTYDANGNLTFDGVFHKKYDAERRLVLDSASPSNKLVYRYDALGRRLQKMTPAGAINYTYAGLAQIEQRNASDGALRNRTFFSSFIKPVAMETAGTTYFFHQNPLRSVEAISNNNGSLVERYDYDPYGQRLIYDGAGNPLSASAAGNRFGFTGQEHDAETGTMRFPFRQYSPETGRFLQPDPLGYYDGMNQYHYAANNPVNNIDPLGLDDGNWYVSETSNLAQNSSFIADAIGQRGADGLTSQIAKMENYIDALGLENMATAARAGITKQVTENLKAIDAAKKHISFLQAERAALLGKLQGISKLNPYLTVADIVWKIYLYKTYKPECPGSDDDMITQSQMVKDIVVGPLGFIATAGLLNLGDYLSEKAFGTSVTNAIVSNTYKMNQYMEKNFEVDTRFGKFNLNPFGPLNWLGQKMGEASLVMEGGGVQAYHQSMPYGK